MTSVVAKINYLYRTNRIDKAKAIKLDELIKYYNKNIRLPYVRDYRSFELVVIVLALNHGIFKPYLRCISYSVFDIETLKPILHKMSNYIIYEDEYKKLEPKYYKKKFIKDEYAFKTWLRSTKKKNREIEEFLISKKLYKLYLTYALKFKMKINDNILDKLDAHSRFLYELHKDKKMSELFKNMKPYIRKNILYHLS